MTITTVLSTTVPPQLQGTGRHPIALRWTIEADDASVAILGYQLEATRDGGSSGTWTVSGATTEQRAADPGPPLTSRERRSYRVRIETSAGWSNWSEPVGVEAGLLAASDWSAKAITLANDSGGREQAPSPLLRKEFSIDGAVARARLHVTALGLHAVTINGHEVSDDVLAPGWTPYDERLLSDAYDVTALLRPGGNAIASALADGWYRGRLGWNPNGDRCHYGSELGLIAQLEIELEDGRVQRIVSDETWRAATGEIRRADLYDGVLIDLREQHPGWREPGFDDASWGAAAVVAHDPQVIEPRVAPPVQVVELIMPERTQRPDGSIAFDGCQNIAGWLRLTVRGKAGDRVVVRHAEVLEPDGSLHIRSLRSAKATDEYVLADDREIVLEPTFSFHGFRYAEVRSDAEIIDARFVAISSAIERRGDFSCSDDALTRFHENVVWSQRDNFVSVPTDCPQRDERLGWTGDAQAFAPTASTLFASEAFWMSWLRDLEIDQDPVLGVPSVVPDVVLGGEARFGRAGWADAATMVPAAVYESYGDPAVLERQLPSMLSWIDSLIARRDANGLLPEAMQFGDWLDPDAPSDRPWAAKADSTFIANAFFAHSARLAARVAEILGKSDEATRLTALGDDVAQRTWARWRDHARTTQTGCAITICFRICPEDQRADIGEALALMVDEADGRVSTGFLGTPLVLPALGDTGHFDAAYRMLLRHEPPSWLYQVDRGATTVWERWDAIRTDGSIHDGRMAPMPEDPEAHEGHMLSFNHYAYGAVIDWVYRNLAGIAPDPDRPGYRHVVLVPHPVDQIQWAKASVQTALGQASVDWRFDGADLVIKASLPVGSTGTVIAPVTAGSAVTIDGAKSNATATIGPGTHTIRVTEPLIARGRARQEVVQHG